MTVHDLNDHRRIARERKAAAYRVAIKDMVADHPELFDPPVDVDSPAGLRLLARSVWAFRDSSALWEGIAAEIGERTPGASWKPGHPEWTRYETVRMIVAGLEADAAALDAEIEDPVLVAQLQASLDALRVG